MPTSSVGAGFAATANLQRVEHSVARILAERDQPVEVYAAVLEVVGRSLGWELGAVWEAAQGTAQLHCICSWHAGEGAPDVFVHMETLRRFGITELRPGQFVLVRYGNGPKGLMVAEIRPDGWGDAPSSH